MEKLKDNLDEVLLKIAKVLHKLVTTYLQYFDLWTSIFRILHTVKNVRYTFFNYFGVFSG